MAANKSQGKSFGGFLVGLVVACAGLAAVATGLGKLALAIGAVIVVLSFAAFLKIKPLEGTPALPSVQHAGMKIVGLALTFGGWLIVLAGLHLTAAVSGRLICTLVGLVVSLCGVIGVLPIACNKNAIWKA
ncbi:MAG: hypothetical protein P4M01_05730 [Acidobacteriota bacterium]|nr:hypothetical protein [Acidobacteriota bacterium]